MTQATSTRRPTTTARLTLAMALSAALGLTSAAMAQKPQVTPVAPAGQPAPGSDAAPRPTDVLADRPGFELDEKAELLGPVYESKGHGISFRTPKDVQVVRRVGSKDIIEFVDEEKGWSLKLSKIMLDKPGSLTETRTPRGQLEPGVLEFTATRLKEEIPDAEFLRQEVTNIADGDVGILALRYTRNLKSLLSQQAIIQKTDQMYYLLALTTPGSAKGAKDATASERVAVETFRRVLDSVKLLDLGAIRQDQDARLFRTRTLLVNFTPDKLRGVMIPEQWMRILKNGKDIGYTYVEEKTTAKGAQDGIEIRLRSRVKTGETQADVGAIQYASMDLRHEDWSTLSEYADLKQKAAKKDYEPAQLTETGVSDRRPVAGRGDAYSLQVLFESTRERVDPVTRDLPPFYLPQAISHLLPRLLPLGAPKTFMFMVYVPESREVMMRYVDVKDVKRLEFNKEMVRAVAIEDRMGLEGSLTVHYMSPDGKWIGSENKESGLTVVPSDKKTLLSLWNDANLSGPEEPAKAGGRQAAAAPEPTDVDAKAAEAPKPRSNRR